MTLTTTLTLAGLAAAALVGWTLGGALGAGALAGYLAGASVAGFGVLRQRRVLRERPDRALRSMVEGFLVKLAVVVVCALLLVLVAPLRERLHPAGFLLAFAGATLVVLLPGTIDNARELRARRPA